jgi:DMSO/TMAO reductase YedYZ molybdopterin-dependent catalytic subunit
MKKLVVIILLAAFSAVLIVGCTAGGDMNGTEELKPVEVREYQGEDLSSINDFRENSIKGPQYIDIESYHLEVTGLVSNPREYTYDEVVGSYQNYKKLVTLNCVEGWSVNILWEGVLVRDLLEESGVLPDAKVVIFHAYDGYTTSLPLDYIMNNDIIMAYKMNDVIIPPERGFPFELVAESKWGYKWIKWITKIELSDDENYRGFWESGGYSNSADLDESFFE